MVPEIVGNLDFKWLDENNREVENNNNNVFVEKVFIPAGKSMLIYGLLLRVENPQVSLIKIYTRTRNDKGKNTEF